MSFAPFPEKAPIGELLHTTVGRGAHPVTYLLVRLALWDSYKLNASPWVVHLIGLTLNASRAFSSYVYHYRPLRLPPWVPCISTRRIFYDADITEFQSYCTCRPQHHTALTDIDIPWDITVLLSWKHYRSHTHLNP